MCYFNSFSLVLVFILVIMLSLHRLNIIKLPDVLILCWSFIEPFIPEPYDPKKASSISQIKPADPQPSCGLDGLVKRKRLADSVREKSFLLTPQTGPLPLYKVPLKEQHINITGCKYFTSGQESPKPNRTIMVSGATGAGKSTLINGMINYILGVQWEDSYRFKMVDEGQSTLQAHSQTSEVTVYKIYHQKGFKVDYSLTVVDTPGFGDVRGVDRDREITEQLRNLFSDKDGIGEIDAVCLVAQAFLTKLTKTQEYAFDSFLSIFGKDVAENIRILVTFADAQQPPVLEAINASGVSCPQTEDGLPVHFKFNNSALFADNTANKTFDQIVWNMGTESMRRFFESLNQIETIRLVMTSKVLKERQELESSVEDLQKQVKLGLAKFEKIRQTSKKLEENEEEIRKNANFEFYVIVTKPVAVDISQTGHFISNCEQCHVTCHFPCKIKNDDEKRGCFAMGQDGYCTVCPGRCFWNVHFNKNYRWEYQVFKEKQTLEELKEKYKKATGEKLTLQQLIDRLKADYKRVQDEVVRLMEKAVNCLNRLKEIALNRNPLSTPQYIHLLIEGEKQEGKPGWEQRVESLMKMKEHAELIAKVERGEELLAHQ
ncbi:uncharacterized protein LOC119618057 [Kryptolebias marmoratus]|uniref:uncharacterized protein LOC119618057 n=1 Tax=Kryptolebias marmoratus TaxID=37003 RepID=UPI0018ACF5A1|nr:uncharacterized protein LOC119618057 [Kryptolebias marmoratus]